MPAPSTILVLGGPSAGKTVFISTLYHHLWNGHDGMVMRASNGTMHSELLGSVESILAGNMPAATASLRHYEFELEHENRIYNLRYLDYPGELFRRVFHEMTIDTDEARELHGYCENAGGVLMLVDPRNVVEASGEADYSLSNLLRFCRSQPTPPEVVVAFTKRDENRDTVGGHVYSFVKKYLPHTARELKRGIHVMHFCSLIKSDHSVQLANALAVKAPLESILEAMEQQQIDRARRSYVRRLAWRDTFGKVFVVLVVAVATILSFMAGVFLRHLVEINR